VERALTTVGALARSLARREARRASGRLAGVDAEEALIQI
jgi:hypothetical protein